MKDKKYDVALSFAGEDRHHAEKLAELLTAGGYLVFYDDFEQAQLWGKNLYTYFSSVYKNEARYCVIFLSKHYAQKLWANHELQSAQARAFQENEEYILPIRLDDTEIPGILPTVGYLDLDSMTIKQVYQALVEKLSGTTSRASATDIPTSAAVESNSTVDTQPILDRMETRIESLAETDDPTLTMIARPVSPYRPMISTADIYNFAEQIGLYNLSKVMGGVSSKDINLPHYWEFNEYGIVYCRIVLERIELRRRSGSDKGQYLNSIEFVRMIGKLIKQSQSFYKECQYSGNIEVTTQLRQVLGEKLRYGLKQSANQIEKEKQQCTDPEILTYIEYLPRDLENKEKFIEIVDELASQLLWAFNVDDPQGRRELVEEILIANKLLES